MIKKILIPFVAGVSQPDNSETRSRFQAMLNYINNSPDDDFCIILSGGGRNKTLAREMLAILRRMDCRTAEDKFLFEEKSWDTTTQIQNNIPIIKQIPGDIEILTFSNPQHLNRISLIFNRFGFKTEEHPSKLGYQSILFRTFYTFVYEPFMYLMTLFRLDNLFSKLTKRRLKKFVT